MIFHDDDCNKDPYQIPTRERDKRRSGKEGPFYYYHDEQRNYVMVKESSKTEHVISMIGKDNAIVENQV